ncbi:DUF6103 family protein [Anaerotignum sp.]|nr:DUF6103 family protein [Anaerotignum sp.]MBQ7759141.1 hypothetical protein [Anaerotignum sp.]
MKQSVIQIKFNSEKYNALLRYAKKKEISIEAELSDTVDKLYKKLVPADVREYIEEKDELVKQKPVSKKQVEEIKKDLVEEICDSNME